MHILDLSKFQAAPVARDPFPHVLVTKSVVEGEVQNVLEDLPLMHKGGSFPISALHLGPAAQQLVAELQGAEFRRLVEEKFILHLGDAQTMTTLRGYSREKDGRIHTDSTSKLVTILLYLNRPEDAWASSQGCLRLLRSKESLEDYVVEVPPALGTLLVFPNSNHAWHGHKQFVGPRYAIQMNYMANDGSARSEIRRHRISAFLKRFA